jgi:(E)-4-hydroxy-3-methylbut-2-enyl-diphosphate synthase
MIKKEIRIGNTAIGGRQPVRIQSMTNTDTADVEATTAQIHALEDAGCEIVRVAAYDTDSAQCIRKLKDACNIPIVADVHFDYKIALKAIEAGADKVRINPGNIGDAAKIRMVADAAKSAGIPIRVGANTGSLGKTYWGMEKSEALVQSALENVRCLERAGFYDIVIALKASDVAASVRAYRKMDALVDYPLHLGITEAGAYDSSIVKSAMGIGALLLDGIGDTLRVSITGDPLQEIRAAKEILQCAGRRTFSPEIIACPTCGRTRIQLETLYHQVKALTADIPQYLKIAVMGCVVNGPGEARDADIGIAGGDGIGIVFKKGKPIAKVPEAQLLETFEKELREMLDGNPA